jgi:hypothetical protein
MGVKFDETKKEKTPGPGQYNQDGSPIRQKSPAFTMSGRPSPQRYSGPPGPGTYKVSSKVVEGPKYGFGSSQRGRNSSPGMHTPGPGSYKIPSKICDLPNYALPTQKEEFRYI